MEGVQNEEYEKYEQFDEILMAQSQFEDGQHEVQDPLEEVNLGDHENPKVVDMSTLLKKKLNRI